MNYCVQEIIIHSCQLLKCPSPPGSWFWNKKTKSILDKASRSNYQFKEITWDKQRNEVTPWGCNQKNPGSGKLQDKQLVSSTKKKKKKGKKQKEIEGNLQSTGDLQAYQYIRICALFGSWLKQAGKRNHKTNRQAWIPTGHLMTSGLLLLILGVRMPSWCIFLKILYL